MSKNGKLFLFALVLGVLLKAATYFYQRAGDHVGVCEVGVESPCNGDLAYDRGFPMRYLSSEGTFSWSALSANIAIWTMTVFAPLKAASMRRLS